MIKLTSGVLGNMLDLYKKIKSGLFRPLGNFHQGFGKIHLFMGFWFFFNFSSYAESVGNTCFYLFTWICQNLKESKQFRSTTDLK